MPSKYGNSAFYKSKEWRKVSAAYMSSKYYICERCGKPAKICHHRIWLNADNVNDPEIALNMDNLEALCMECHNKEHIGKSYYRRGPEETHFDENGNLVKESVVFIVCGAPASGKTTYVREHKREGDLVFDLDMICSALIGEPETYYFDHMPVLDAALSIRDTVYDHVERRLGSWGRAWIITSNPDRDYCKYLASRLRAEIVELDTTEEECLRRIEADDRRKNKRQFADLVRDWYAKRASPVVSCEVGDNEREEKNRV